MTDQEVYSKIEEIYNSEKGKNFITHLINSFFPADKAEFMWFDPEDNRKMECCITGTPLMSKGEAFEKATSDMETDLKMFTAAVLETVDDPNSGEKAKALAEHRKKKFEGKILGLHSKESSKFLCEQAWQQLYNFYATELIKGNGHMAWVGKNMRKKAFIEHRKSSGKPLEKKEEQVLNKVVNKPAKVNMDDRGVLKALKEKLDSEEK